MSESLYELEVALADAQREYGLAEDEFYRRASRYNDKPTLKRGNKLLDARRTREATSKEWFRLVDAVGRAQFDAQAKEAEHPPLKEGLSTRVTDEDLAKLRAEGQLFDVAAADAVDELDNPASPIVEVDAPLCAACGHPETQHGDDPSYWGCWYRACYCEGFDRTPAGRHRADDAPAGTYDEQKAMTDYVADHRDDGDRQPDNDTSTPVVTLAPVNGEGRFVPTADVDLPVLEDTREWTAIGTIADGPGFEGATAYLEQGYTRNEQGAYEYDGPVGEQPDVPAWDGVTPAPGNPEWESTIRNLYGISEDTPIVAHKEMWTTWDGRTQSRTSYKPGEQPEIPHHTHTVNDGPVSQPWADPNHDVMADIQMAFDKVRMTGPAQAMTPVETDDTNLPYLYPNEKWTGDINQEPLQRDAYMTLTGGPDPRAPKEPNVITTRRLGERFQGLPVYVQDGMAKDTVYVLPGVTGPAGAALMGSDTFTSLKSKMDEVRQPVDNPFSYASERASRDIIRENTDVASAFDLKAKLDRIRDITRDIGAMDGVGDPTTTEMSDEAGAAKLAEHRAEKAEPDEAPAQPTAEEQAVIDAGKAAQARADREGFSVFAPLGRPSPFRYREAFAKAGDVPSAPADHVSGVTDPESVTVDTERDVENFGSDTVKLKSQTITGSFTLQEAQPKHFQTIFPNARVVIGSDGKVDITANTMATAAEHVAASKPTTPEGKLLAEAAQIIGHDRNDQYGNAEDSFGVIAEFWSTWLTARRGQIDGLEDGTDALTLTAADVANMLGLMKKARTAVGGYKHDSYVDEAGYVALAERCEAKGSGL